MKLQELADLLGGTLHGDGSLEFARPLPPVEAGSADLAVAMQPELLGDLGRSPARVGLLANGTEPPEGTLDAWVCVGRPRYALHRLTGALGQEPFVAPGIHPTAVVEPGAEVSPDASLGAFVYVGPRARIGRGARILNHVSIGQDAVIGEDTLLHPGVRVGERVRIGARVIIHSNAALGADGFSFVTPEPGSVEHARSSGSGKVSSFNEHIARIHSLGSVVVGDDVEIGANTCIDKGTLTDTCIGSGTKIDDLVMIGHNVRIGMLCMICGQVGIAGSTVIGNGVVLAGGVGVADHAKIGDHAVVGARSGVMGEIPEKEVWMGYPARPRKETMEIFVYQSKLKALFREVSDFRKAFASFLEDGRGK
ncbi:UDP-3-O-(3-hydroxymyristoyl)glucosamine N-acyltransferase [Phaeovibrio sulfidiphilus]|uniref:UDP-3-O-acylglucosamine N-acyltransferase n=1 Tax=Phaeovibrio sulfidiphilus TaxID=1220600 RepID=A0A8J6YPT3_9PROT|nr:UDP-3-O-(3-hydroxymyristoyl)glucosamine N-acyltransferase [Phaeovibrio sulfidiphilus]MBE1237027.1 UDP-3-O-(3-hydroxymyristoyl)glucosamine N-acyltransferase [Phaeovibrio sulfidiphilus]